MRWVYDDGGREAAGFKGRVRDCACRAVAIAMERPYAEIYAELNEHAQRHEKRRKLGRGSSSRNGYWRPTLEAYLRRHGWEWVPAMRIGSGCTVTLDDGQLPSGRLIVRVSRHFVAVVDGVIRDNHDPSRGGSRCVYGYFVRAA